MMKFYTMFMLGKGMCAIRPDTWREEKVSYYVMDSW
jgi:hypothetical protein